jgi:hypothetical protein
MTIDYKMRMAEFIPDRLPSRASRGEERTFNVLKKLPDDYLVYYEPQIENRHPDFIVIAPDLGVIVIEVKGWYIDDIVQGNDFEIVINDNGREKREIHPLEQARNYQWRLVRACEKNPNFTHLLHKDGPHKNRFIFPFVHFVILSNITQKQLKSQAGNDFSLIFRPENTMTRDVLLALEQASGDVISKALVSYFDPFWNIEPLSSDQIDVLRAVIHPEIIISYLSLKPIAAPKSESELIQVLDRKQENNARKIGEGHRILCGVAGSGKTLLLIARARWLHERDPEANILLLCYNVSLATYLKNTLKDFPRIKVTHFDGWAKYNGISRFSEDPKTGKVENDESIGNRLFERLNSRVGDFRRYDAVLIDEAQDFHSNWFSCILLAMKDPNDGDLLIVCDGNQGIRPIENLSWKSLGIRAQGRTIHRALDLDKNYRNTHEILKLASLFAVKDMSYDEDSFGMIPVNPDQAIRHGVKPFLVNSKDHTEEGQKAIEIVRNLLEGVLPNGQTIKNLHPEDIGILYRKASINDKRLLEHLVVELSQVAPVIWVTKDYHSRCCVE